MVFGMDFNENLELDTEQEGDSSSELDMEPDTETGTEETDGALEDAGDSGGNTGSELTDRLDALIDILTPEEPDASENEDVSGTDVDSGTEQGALDACSQELLESINGTLFMIKSENVSYHAEMLYYQEEMLAGQEHLSACIEFTILLLFGAAFFVALSAGCRLADSFFSRMRG